MSGTRYESPFPIKKFGDRDFYFCYRHGLRFATAELSLLHYAVDHEKKGMKKSGYFGNLKT